MVVPSTTRVPSGTMPTGYAAWRTLTSARDVAHPCRVRRCLGAMAVVIALHAGTASAWVQSMAGTTRKAGFVVMLLAVDSSGAAFVAAPAARPSTADDDAIVVRFDAESGVERWRTFLPSSFPTALAVDPVGGAVVAGAIRGDQQSFEVASLVAADGAVRWVTTLGPGAPRSVAVAPNGRIFAGGSIDFAFGTHGVVSLDPVGGSPQWQGAPGMSVSEIASAPNGDVVAAGQLPPTSFSDFTVLRLAGADGAERWRYVINGSWQAVDGTSISWDVGTSVVVGADGAVFATGWTQKAAEEFGSNLDLVVVKLSGVTGEEIWRQDVAGPRDSDDRGSKVVLDGSGNAIVVGGIGLNSDRPYGLVKLDGVTGAVRWLSRLDGPLGNGTVRDVAIAGDDVLVAGSSVPNGDPAFAIARLDGASGEARWVHEIQGLGAEQPDSYNHDWATSIALDARGRVVAGGLLRNRGGADTAGDVTVVEFSDRLAGTRLMLRERHRRRGSGRLVVAAQSRDVLATSGRGADPTASGASLELVNPTTGEGVRFPLPAVGWTAGGGATLGSLRYSYEDADGTHGPCRRAVLTGGKRFALRCSGTLGFHLDEPQHVLAARLVVGDQGASYCVRFGGDVIRDEPTEGFASGVFEARRAPAPDVCP